MAPATNLQKKLKIVQKKILNRSMPARSNHASTNIKDVEERIQVVVKQRHEAYWLKLKLDPGGGGGKGKREVKEEERREGKEEERRKGRRRREGREGGEGGKGKYKEGGKGGRGKERRRTEEEGVESKELRG